MELCYHVSEDDYIRCIQARRKARLRQPVNILFTAIAALIPLGIFAFCWARRLFTGWPLALLGAAALALSAANLSVRLGYWKRADAELAVLKKTGRVSDDFWKEHRLTVSEDGVALKSGDYSARYGWASFGGFERREGLLLPIFDARPMDLIPIKALERSGGAEAFQRAFTEIAKKSLRAGRDMDLGEPVLRYAYTKEAYIRDQRDARRRRYATRLIWTRAALAKLLLSGVMVYAAWASAALWLRLAYVFILLVLNYEHLHTFSPLLERQLERQLRPVLALEPERWAELFLTADGVIVRGDVHLLELPLSEAVALRRLPHGAALYLASQTILTVPGEAGEEFYRRMEKALRDR